MKKIRLTLIFGILISNFGFSQSKSEIENLLNGISKIENSKEITKTEQAQKLIKYSWRILPTLAEFFTDQTLTNIKSECQDRILKKGELAIILADRIEGMPEFKEKYNEWLASDDRIDWTPMLNYNSKKELRKIKRERKKSIREMQSGK